MSKSIAFTPIVLCAAVLPCALIAWGLGGVHGRGAMLGYLLGAGSSSLSFAWQRHQWRFRPERALRANIEGFLVKVGALFCGVLVLRAVPVLDAQVDLRAFLLAYAAAVAMALPLLAIDANRLLGAGRRSA
ncbi:MAG TPA: hypothetical protein VM509_12665 [Planctomycetota bacterium]|nr:hypothetical protein [Planctomycetota bacterium]